MKAIFGGASLTTSPEEETKPMTLPKVTPGSATRTKEFKVPKEAMKNLTITETEEREDDSKRRISVSRNQTYKSSIRENPQIDRGKNCMSY